MKYHENHEKLGLTSSRFGYWINWIIIELYDDSVINVKGNKVFNIIA